MKVPKFQDPEVTKFLNLWDIELQRNQKDSLSANGGNRSLLLYSPSKIVYEITVDDAGVIHSTKVSG